MPASPPATACCASAPARRMRRSRMARCRAGSARSWPSVARRIAYRPVRNRGTIGGSLAHADPAADWVAVLPALGATAIALGPRGERRIAAAGFVKGIFETALASDELLRAVEVPVLPAEARWGHWKFCRKVGEFSKATSCVLALPGQPPRAVLAALDAPAAGDRGRAGADARSGWPKPSASWTASPASRPGAAPSPRRRCAAPPKWQTRHEQDRDLAHRERRAPPGAGRAARAARRPFARRR